MLKDSINLYWCFCC